MPLHQRQSRLSFVSVNAVYFGSAFEPPKMAETNLAELVTCRQLQKRFLIFQKYRKHTLCPLCLLFV